MDIELIEHTSNTYSTFERPYIISLDFDFSYINVTNVSPSKEFSHNGHEYNWFDFCFVKKIVEIIELNK